MLQLVKLEKKYISQLMEMMDEWTATGEKIIPWSIRKCDYHDIDAYMESLEATAASSKYVPDSTFFCIDTRRNIFVGAVNIRHYLNEQLLLDGGHIGDGIRPSERGKGFGTKFRDIGSIYNKRSSKKRADIRTLPALFLNHHMVCVLARSSARQMKLRVEDLLLSFQKVICQKLLLHIFKSKALDRI